MRRPRFALWHLLLAVALAALALAWSRPRPPRIVADRTGCFVNQEDPSAMIAR
jgi:hypothetical protein